jgi:antitoxin MazE
MRVEIKKWGNSLVVRIPNAYAKELGVSEGAPADLRIEGGKLLLDPVVRSPEYDLDELVAGITEENRHPEVDWGPAVGKEVW